MEFEWDENKRKTNLRTHGIDFKGIDSVFNGYTLTIEDTRFEYGEQRFLTLGVLNGRVVVIVHTEREETIRIISIRKATKHEQSRYFSQI